MKSLSPSLLVAILLLAAVCPFSSVQWARSQQKAVIVGVTGKWWWNGPILQDLRPKDRKNEKSLHFLDPFLLDDNACAVGNGGSLVVQFGG